MTNKDFTLVTYKKLLKEFKKADCFFLTLEQYYDSTRLAERIIILRHDIDRKPENALKMAEIEANLGIQSSYYFRIAKESYNEKIIKKIAGFQHEVGYHYEDLASSKGDFEKAIKTFEKNLNKMKGFYPIKTICMHGSPLSKWDNRLLWEKYDYRDFGILAEPYFDLDFNRTFYITDAGRSWNDEKATLRDKVKSNFVFSLKSTSDIIHLMKENKLPNEIMVNIHPHNWAGSFLEWVQVLIWQGFKNIVKRIIA